MTGCVRSRDCGWAWSDHMTTGGCGQVHDNDGYT